MLYNILIGIGAGILFGGVGTAYSLLHTHFYNKKHDKEKL